MACLMILSAGSLETTIVSLHLLPRGAILTACHRRSGAPRTSPPPAWPGRPNQGRSGRPLVGALVSYNSAPPPCLCELPRRHDEVVRDLPAKLTTDREGAADRDRAGARLERREQQIDPIRHRRPIRTCGDTEAVEIVAGEKETERRRRAPICSGTGART